MVSQSVLYSFYMDGEQTLWLFLLSSVAMLWRRQWWQLVIWHLLIKCKTYDQPFEILYYDKSFYDACGLYNQI